jgi:porphyrinogen peroxidase
MPIAPPIQPGILETIPAHARYLSFQLRMGCDPRRALGALAEQADGLNTVVGLGASLVRELGAEMPGLKTFTGIEGARVKLPATPVDLLIWLRGNARGELLATAQEIEALLAPAFELEDVTDAFNHDGGKDLTGYEDGTENPQGEAALTAAFVPAGAPAPEGSSFLAMQRWRHQLRQFAAMPREQQDNTFGRERVSNEEMDEAPASAHVKRTAQEDFEPEAFVLRRSMPWSEGNEGGLVFTAFGHSFDAFEALLGRMSGAEDGVTDALFSFTEPQTGAYFWCPPMHQGQLDLRSLGL